ncbi:hypothetical protein [Paracoccus sp. (in: a-proteobacteria)]|uniref:hypothetical protein n=1 Tax=Paracoccus sp. TaxID=267 RepID=UPI003A83D1A8
MLTPARTFFAATVFAGSLVLSSGSFASPYPLLPDSDYPGDRFDWTNPSDGYQWRVDLSGIDTASSLPVTVVDFTVDNVMGFPATIPLFQIFANCTGGSVTWARFKLKINGLATPWTSTIPDLCLYHDYMDFSLPPGVSRFTVDMINVTDFSQLEHADVRFGAVIPAIPLPGALLLGLSGLVAIGAMSGRVRRRRA